MRFPIIYLHIPKTAGTSFRVSAEHYFGPSYVLNDYGKESPNTSDDIKDAVYAENDGDKLRSAGLDYKFLTGHFGIAKYREIFPDSPVVTFFRDPVERVLSEYVHFTTHYNFTGSLRDFYTSQQFQNRQSQTLAGALPTDLDFYGLTEDYENSLNLFNTKYGTKFPMATLNTGKYRGRAQSIATAAELAQIKELNQNDVEVYEYAVKHFEEQEAIESRPFTNTMRYSGSVGKFNRGKLVGWTVDRESLEPASITVLVNGEARSHIVAGSFREDVQRRGLHVNGHCGFEVNLEELGNVSPGDRISVWTGDGHFELTNSPVIVPG